MDNPQVSDAARLMVSKRWGASRPIRLVHELLPRVTELPELERRQLLNALLTKDVRHG